jgi:hypothetical protein
MFAITYIRARYSLCCQVATDAAALPGKLLGSAAASAKQAVADSAKAVAKVRIHVATDSIVYSLLSHMLFYWYFFSLRLLGTCQACLQRARQRLSQLLMQWLLRRHGAPGRFATGPSVFCLVQHSCTDWARQHPQRSARTSKLREALPNPLHLTPPRRDALRK